MYVEVEQANAHEIETVLDILVSAFAEDPIICWLLGARQEDDASRRLLFQHPASQLLRDGVVEMTPLKNAVALWKKPGFGTPNAWDMITDNLGALVATVRATRTNITKAIKLHDSMQRHRPREPHWYLSMIGTLPEARGQGCAGALLAARLSDADLAHAPAYLESSSSNNVPLYQRHGFDVVEELHIDDSPPLWAMYRSAR